MRHGADSRHQAVVPDEKRGTAGISGAGFPEDAEKDVGSPKITDKNVCATRCFNDLQPGGTGIPEDAEKALNDSVERVPEASGRDFFEVLFLGLPAGVLSRML
jgi:hypothetical protein